MAKLKETSGISGAVRVSRMTSQAMSSMESHGKRLDTNGKARQKNANEALTTTGLELRELYDKHVENAVLATGAAKGLHVLLQFPTELVNGDDADLMLMHSRKFAEKHFGKNAIFADRVDRDETSRHNVDLFLTPIYEKQYKPDKYGNPQESKQKVSVTRGLKDLAKKYGKSFGLKGQGQALQDAWFEYLRDEMGLPGVVRGSPKKTAGSDRLTPEELEIERKSIELDAREASLEGKLAKSQNMRKRALDRLVDISVKEKSFDADLSAFEAEKVAFQADKKTIEKAGDIVRETYENNAKISAELANREAALKLEIEAFQALQEKTKAENEDAEKQQKMKGSRTFAANNYLKQAKSERDSHRKKAKGRKAIYNRRG